MSEAEPTAAVTDAHTSSRPAAVAAEHSYTITITNLTQKQPLAPPLLVTHTKQVDLFEVGEPAGVGVEGVAETGAPAGPNTSSYLANLREKDGVYAAEWVTGPGPVPPEGTRSYPITAAVDANRLSAATMLVCTNDGFTGLDSLRLPHGKKARTMEIYSYDAGTEVNTEAEGDLVGGCESGSHGRDLSAGPSEDGAVSSPHSGIDAETDGDDVLDGNFDWDEPVARLTIRRELPN